MSTELRRIRTFVAIAEHGGFTSAGNALGLTQSAISNQMRSLEDDLGIKLFDRTKRPPILNSSGIGLLGEAKAILQSYAELGLGITGVDKDKVHVRVSATATPLISIIPEVLARLALDHRNVSVAVSSGMSRNICHQVINGEIDCGLITELDALPTGLSYVPICHDELVGLVPPTSKAETLREAIEAHPFIAISRDTSVRRLIDHALAEEGLAPSGSFELDSFEAIVRMVGRGLGCAIVSSHALQAVRLPKARRVAFRDQALSRTFGFVERTKAVTLPGVAAMRAVLTTLYG